MTEPIAKRWRAWLRAIHRDCGYVAVGFTIIYALSGLAINHIADWDPNFTTSERVVTLDHAITGSDSDAAVAAAVGMPRADDVYRAGDELRLTYDDGTRVTATGSQITIQTRSSRWFFRVANWLHYNRGKQAWTYVADAFAIMLLYLAISGVFMIKGRLGLRWRGTILVSSGVLVPIVYVALSGGPSAKSGTVSVPVPVPAPVPVPVPAPVPAPAPAATPRAATLRSSRHSHPTTTASDSAR